MNKEEKEKLITAWIKATKAGAKMPTHTDNDWAIDIFIDLPDQNPELLWSLIQDIINIENDENLLANLAAGPIEDLMCVYGEEIIERVKKEAKENIKFKQCIQGVWLDSNDTTAFKQFYEAAGIEPPFKQNA